MARHRDQAPEPGARPNGSAEPRAGRGNGRAAETRTVNLALQRGGAHGAVAWGVLDRLMEGDLIDIERIAATSAGTMNATVLAHGFTSGGREGARKALID